MQLSFRSASTAPSDEYRIDILHSSNCDNPSRRGNVLEIDYYTARMILGRPSGEAVVVVYDSSAQCGTGLPYQMVLGSGDMLPGVDQGLYDMCPGEVRRITIPPILGFGVKGNKLFGIPGNAALSWDIELVRINQ